MAKKSTFNRREFISSAAIIGAGSSIGAGAILSSCSETKSGDKLVPLGDLSTMYVPDLPDYANDGQVIKVGLIGCGSRGTGAIANFLDAGPNLQVAALGDVFMDQIDKCRELLKKRNIEVPDNMCFTGLDNYKGVIGAGVDLVILTTPPVFRPMHFEAAVAAGKHVFMEKPSCVDAVGARSVLATAKKADAQGLCVVNGSQRRHQRGYVESFKQIQSGIIGDIVSAKVSWNGGMLWWKQHDPKWSDVEYLLRDWVNWTEFSGDHIVEQHCHNLDVFNWMSGKKPLSAVGFGYQIDKHDGDQYNMFSIDFIYEGGIHVQSMCRQIPGCSSDVSEFIQGTKGSWSSKQYEIKDLHENVIWSYDVAKEKEQFKQTNPYVLEHVALINHIRAKKPINMAESLTISTLTAILGRDSAYTGKLLTWDQVYNSQQSLIPEVEKLALGKYDMSKMVVRIPGDRKQADPRT